MHEQGMQAPPGVAMNTVQVGYSLQVEHPRSATKTVETYASLPAVVARATELIQAGYHIGIRSPASVEEH